MSAPKAVIAPSLLSCDFANLQSECERMLESGADTLHVDVMDGHFVPNLTLGPPIVDAIRRACPKAYLDCHLMISRVAEYVPQFAKAGASGITFHVEAVDDARVICQQIRALSVDVGVALKPNTSDSVVHGLVKDGLVDMVLVMTVEPGFGGQSFMPEQMAKVANLRRLFPTLNIQVDGGVNEDTIDACAAAGANVVVSGSGIFKSDKGPKEAISILRSAIDNA